MLISTKLQPPSLREGLLFRKLLVDRLCTANEAPLVMILGPAGSGKTSLAGQWIEQKKLRVAWYSLDEEDNAPDLFFRYLLTSLIQADQRLKTAFEPMLANRRELQAENVIPQLIEALSRLSDDIQLVLDDFHQITNSYIHASLARLIQNKPARLQFVVLSRYSFPAAMGSAVFKTGYMAITAEELKFTETETLDLLKKFTPNGFTANQIRDLNQHVEGWAAGLQLIGLVTKTKGLNTDLSAILNQAHDQIASYLIYDILRNQPQKIRDFIFTTVFLDRFNLELCIEVTGMPDAPEIVTRLERMNLFLVPLDIKRKWYRYHHMFAEVVQRQVAQFDPESIPATLCKAAKWLARKNHMEDALRSAFRSNDVEFTADLIEDYIIRYIETLDFTTGLRWILKLPDSVLNQRALLRLQQCTFLFIMMKPAEARDIFSSIEPNGEPDFSRYSGNKLALCQEYRNYFKCMLGILYAGSTKALAEFQALQSKFLPKNRLLAATIEFMMVYILISNGDLTMAEAFLSKINKISVSDSGWKARKKIHFAKAESLIAKYRGRLHEAEAIIRKALEGLDQQNYGHPSVPFLLHRHLGHIFYLQNKIEKAQAYASLAIEHCEHYGLLDEILSGNELQLQIHLATGDNEQVERCIQKIRHISNKLEMPSVALCADAIAARLAISEKNISTAQLWSRQRKVEPYEPFSLLFAMECLTQARLYYAQGHYKEMVSLLDILRKRCIKRDLANLVLQIDILYSAALYAMNQIEKAVSMCKEALAFAQTQGYLRPFVNDIDLIAPILRHIADEPPNTLSKDYLEKLFSACDMPLHGPVTPHCNNDDEFESLSQREIEILKWMAQGYQNKEIAQKAFISINTVKTHVRKILIKLNVKTRTQAILKAGK